MKRCQRLCLVAVAIVLLFRSIVFASSEDWICPNCGVTAKKNFCSVCGEPRPSEEWSCPNCGNVTTGKFCNNCGQKNPNITGSKDYLETTFTSSSPNIGNATISLKRGFYFIKKDSHIFDYDLALTAITLSAQVYKNAKGRKAQDILYELGYKKVDFKNVDSSLGNPGVCFGYKRLEDGKNIFAVVVRGTDTTDDLTDVRTDLEDGALTMFNVSSKSIESKFEDFMEEATGKSKGQLLKEDNYFFLTGHSLGGAIANNMSVDSNIVRLANKDKGKIYTYTFEAPHTCVNLWWTDPESESNAFNYKVDGDAVTNLPPYIGSTTYGKDVWIRVSELDDELFSEVFPKSKSRTLALATSVDGHGDIFGLHDVCLGLMYLMGEQNAKVSDINYEEDGEEDDYEYEEDDVQDDYEYEEDDVQDDYEGYTNDEGMNTQYSYITDFSIEGKWKNIGYDTYGQVGQNAIVVFNGINCNVVSPSDTYAFYKANNNYKLDCSTLLFGDNISFTVEIISNDRINLNHGSTCIELQRVG